MDSPSNKFFTAFSNFKNIGIISLAFFLVGCEELAPTITSPEEQKAAAILSAKSQAWQASQQSRILQVAAKLMEVSQEPKPLQFYFYGTQDENIGFDPDSPNAWTDGQNVIVTRGLLRFLKSDDELAVVLAHEMAHAFRGHIENQLGAQVAGEIIAAFVTKLVDPNLKYQGTTENIKKVINLQFTQGQEREADLFGFVWASKAGYDLRAGSRIWERWAIEMPESLQSGYLADHPSSAERMLAANKVMESLKAGIDPTAPPPKNQSP